MAAVDSRYVAVEAAALLPAADERTCPEALQADAIASRDPLAYRLKHLFV